MKVINLDKDIFEKACLLCEKEFSYEEIIEVLKSDDDVEKQIAILKLAEIKTIEDARLLIFHLTGQDGPIREATAIKLNELILNNRATFIDNKDFYSHCINAVCDVNPNICRLVIDFLPLLSNQNEIIQLLMNKIENIYNRIDEPDVEQKNFLTVRLFNLYWCLETLGILFSKDEKLQVNQEKLSYFLKRAIEFDNYTINEKVARIVVCAKSCCFDKSLVEDLKRSQNFYVNRYFENSVS